MTFGEKLSKLRKDQNYTQGRNAHGNRCIAATDKSELDFVGQI